MWTNPVDLLVQRFPGSSALAASTILGETPSCVDVHRHALDLVAAYDESWPYAERLRRAVPGEAAELTVLVHLEPLLRRLVVLLEELAERPHRARRLTRRLDAVLTTLETCPRPTARTAARRAARADRRGRVGSPRLRRSRPSEEV